MKNSSFSYSRISIEKSIQNSDRKKDVFPYWAYNSTIMDKNAAAPLLFQGWVIVEQFKCEEASEFFKNSDQKRRWLPISSLKFYNRGLAKNAAPLLFQGWVIVEQSLEACTSLLLCWSTVKLGVFEVLQKKLYFVSKIVLF